MTNLEYYKDEIYKTQKDLFDKGLCMSDSIGVAICNVYEKQIGLSAFMPVVLDWLLEEYKEPIKLKQWEKDLISIYDENRSIDYRFSSFFTLDKLKEKGYFKGVTDTSIKIGDILKNCEVIK